MSAAGGAVAAARARSIVRGLAVGLGSVSLGLGSVSVASEEEDGVEVLVVLGRSRRGLYVGRSLG